MSAPNKAQREQCWAAKDTYWKCLDDNASDITRCQDLKDKFNKSCSKTWAKYFERRREYLKYKDKIEKEGFEPVTDKSGS